jgi:surface polysaccharide O-acyltransferase-like enzyme
MAFFGQRETKRSMAMEQDGASRTNHFIVHLHAFRGISIALIVFFNCGAYGIYRLGQDPFLDYLGLASVLEGLAHNATVFFALISGLLYAVLLSNRSWRSFFRGKLLNVLVPYIFMSILLTPVVMPFSGGLELYSGTSRELLETVFWNILQGKASFTYWYIPVLAGLFALTPVVVTMLAQKWGNAALLVLLVIPLFISRTFPENSVQNVFVFLAPYSFGIWLGSDYEVRLTMVRRLALPLTIITTLATIAVCWLFIEYTGPALVTGAKPDWSINWYESVSYAQKMSLACLILLVLHRHEGWLPRPLDLLATHAFAIYFLHAAVIRLVLNGADALAIRVGSAWMNAVMVIVLWALVLSISLALSMILSRLLGRNSRIFIGS